jgi:hypothetical protein
MIPGRRPRAGASVDYSGPMVGRGGLASKASRVTAAGAGPPWLRCPLAGDVQGSGCRSLASQLNALDADDGSALGCSPASPACFEPGFGAPGGRVVVSPLAAPWWAPIRRICAHRHLDGAAGLAQRLSAKPPDIAAPRGWGLACATPGCRHEVPLTSRGEPAPATGGAGGRRSCLRPEDHRCAHGGTVRRSQGAGLRGQPPDPDRDKGQDAALMPAPAAVGKGA